MPYGAWRGCQSVRVPGCQDAKVRECKNAKVRECESWRGRLSENAIMPECFIATV